MKELNTTDVSKRYRAFALGFVPCSNRRGSRISIHDLRHGKRKIIPYNHDVQGRTDDQALTYLASIGIKVTALALCDFGMKHNVVLLSEDFATPLK